MTEPENNKAAVNDSEDWAIIPFDEAEDDARWTKLIEETDELIKEAEKTSNHHGVALTHSKLSDLKAADEPAEDPLF